MKFLEKTFDGFEPPLSLRQRLEYFFIARRVKRAIKRAKTNRVCVDLPFRYDNDAEFEQLRQFLSSHLGIPLEAMAQERILERLVGFDHELYIYLDRL